ncbi:MAG: hypothetical protein ACJAYJ_002106 [Saprospiraceae bacterium]|jgi:hypothetical protein
MPKEFTFEPLLYLAAEAFQQKTGQDWNYLPEEGFSYKHIVRIFYEI